MSVVARFTGPPLPLAVLRDSAQTAPDAGGPLARLLADRAVTDIFVNGPMEVWVDRGTGLVRTGVAFGSAEHLRRYAQRLAAGCGRRLDDGCPCVDARLPDGTRLHAVLPPLATRGPYLSLRKFRSAGFSLDELVALGTVASDAAALLAAIVAGRLPFLISGGTGSGKTTLLSTLLGLVPPSERIVLVEDAAELSPAHPHVLGLQARTSNVEGAGAVTMRELVRQALRMRPDRLIVGECRGAEIIDLLGALNTGHDGGCGTLHANAAADVPARLEALGLLGGLPRDALHAQLAAALRVVIHLRRDRNERLLDEICLLVPSGPRRLVRVVPAWHRGTGPGPAAAEFVALLAERGVNSPHPPRPGAGASR